MTLARDFFRALNDADLDTMAAMYHPSCVVEQVWVDGPDAVLGRENVRGRWAAEFAA